MLSGNSQLAVYPETKVPGRMKGKLECLLKLLKGPLAEPQIASLLFTTQPLTWLKPYINYQPPQWNVSAAALPFGFSWH